MQNLRPYYKNSTENYSVSTQINLNPQDIEVVFKVKCENGFISKEEFDKNSLENWGLWETDVVECFIQPRSSEDKLTDKYFEMQLSPLAQPFALEITKPREEFATPKDWPVKMFSQVDGKVWTAKFIIPSSFLNSEHIYIGLFACLGSGEREFFGTNIDEEGRLDFHKPQRFLAIEELL
jgi:hypothetical protein